MEKFENKRRYKIMKKAIITLRNFKITKEEIENGKEITKSLS